MIARWASSSGRSGGGRAARPTARGLAVRGTHGGASGSGKPGPSRRVALRPATSFRTRRSSNMVAPSPSSCGAARQAERETWRRRRRDGASSLTLHPAGGAPSARSVRHMRRPRAMGSPSVAVSAVDREHQSAREGLPEDAVLGAQPDARPLTGSGPGCTPTRAFTRPRAVSAPAWPAPLRYATGPTVDPVASRVRCLVALNACRRRTALRPGLLAAGPASNCTLLRMGATRASWPLLAPSRRTCVRSAEPAAADANSRARVPPTEPRDRVPTFSVHLTASEKSFSYGCAGATCVRARGAPRPRWPCA